MSARFVAGCIAGLLALPAAALAQRTAENAVESADDAFGSTVGLEQTGIYTEQDTRGFSPIRAGNMRIDGVYYDPVGALSSRLRAGNTVRVGFSAEEYPFAAPTAIVEYRLRPFPDKLGASLAYNLMAYGGSIREADLRVPLADGKAGLLLGAATSDLRFNDGSQSKAWGVTARALVRLGGIELAPFASRARFNSNLLHPLVVVSGDALPAYPARRRFLGQRWAAGRSDNHQTGIVIKGALSSRLSLRAGLFHADGDKDANFTEIFAISPADPTLASHRLIADPPHRVRSTSGETQLGWRIADGSWQHRLIAGVRSRHRVTESGGSDLRNFGVIRWGEPAPHPEPAFAFTRDNHGTVRQTALTAAYIGKLAGVGSLNLGVQRASYRARLRDGRTGLVNATGTQAWLYNATLGLDLSPRLAVYLGTQRGLEDSGVAPENAANRNEQLPATRTRQVEGGVRWTTPIGPLVVSAFEITKPYFSFAAGGVYTSVGQVRHRGIEGSLHAHVGKRLSVLAGGVLMRPRVTGAARDAGLVGKRPAGTPSAYVKIDATYHTDLLGGLTPTAAFTYTSRRAVGLRPVAGRQLMVEAFPVLDLGLRQQFHIGKLPASFRAVVQNVTDARTWKVVAANTMYVDEARRFTLSLAADF